MPGKFAERKALTYAKTKAEHDEVVDAKGRPFTQDPIKRRSDVDKVAPKLVAPEVFGVAVPEDVA